MDFIGRQADLAFLETYFAKQEAQLVVLYGRRRVGKTECLRQFSHNKSCIWYSCTKDTDALQLRGFSRRILAHIPSLARHLSTFDTWQDALESIPDTDIPGKKLVIIDEFPYAASGNAALPSILQNVWDETLSRANVMIVLCGSSISFMEDELLSEKNPLYGRATGVWKMEPLSFSEARSFFPMLSPQQQLETYGILGGIPHYLKQFDPQLGIDENVRRNILSRGCALYSEVDFMLRQELREPAVYNAVLSAVAAGETSLNGIAQKALVDARTAQTYLRKLLELRIVRREFSVQAGQQERTKQGRGLWRIEDNFVAFWYAAVLPWLSELDAGDVEEVWAQEIKPSLNNILATPFENVCLQWITNGNGRKSVPFHLQSVGRWWNKTEEIDIVGLGRDKQRLLCECKFKNSPVGPSLLAQLREKERANFPVGQSTFWLFSKSGFSDDGAWAAGLSDVRLIGPEELTA